MKILITGASGFVASQIIPHLLGNGAQLVLISRDVAALRARYPKCASGDYDAWDSLAEDVDAVLHLAAKNNDADGSAEAFHDVNIGLLRDVLRATKNSGIAQLIFASSIHARPETAGKSHYATSKMAAEKLLEDQHNLAIRIYQLAAVYGTELAGNLAIVTRFPTPVRPALFKILGALRPTLQARRLADEILNAVNDPRSERKILTDQQRNNPAFNLCKRGIDLVFAATVGLLFWWLIAIVWLAVKLTSEGPGIFAQQRVGQHGKQFICYKFRTMKKYTEQAGTHELTSTSVTTIGKLLRKTKVDELPQIINILKGEMSLIGPRPCLPTQIELIEARRALGVLDVRPGISGLSQIRNIDMSTPKALAQSDAEYIALRSLPLEMKIILATATGSGQGDKIHDT